MKGMALHVLTTSNIAAPATESRPEGQDQWCDTEVRFAVLLYTNTDTVHTSVTVT